MKGIKLVLSLALLGVVFAPGAFARERIYQALEKSERIHSSVLVRSKNGVLDRKDIVTTQYTYLVDDGEEVTEMALYDGVWDKRPWTQRHYKIVAVVKGLRKFCEFAGPFAVLTYFK